MLNTNAATSLQRVPITVTRKYTTPEEVKIYYVTPEFKGAEDVTDEDSLRKAPQSRAWQFHGDETMHPFWAVERLTKDLPCNSIWD